MAMNGSGVPVELARILGSTVAEIADLTTPWNSGTSTSLVSIDGGEPVILQWTADRASMARRLLIGWSLPGLAPGLPLGAVLAGDEGGPIPYVVSRYVPGRPGTALLADEVAGEQLGRAIGEIVPELGRVPFDSLGLPATWGTASALQGAAERWQAGAAAALDARLAAAIDQAIDQLAAVFAGQPPVFAHGDLAPTNVVVREGHVVALLDFERARIAHPLFDAAWFRLIVRFHHPDQWARLGPAFMAAAGVATTSDTTSVLDVLAMLQCLEMLQRTGRSGWVERLAVVVDWSGTTTQAR